MSDNFSGGSDRVTVVTQTSWLSRLMSSFIGVLAGIAMVIGGIILLWWNEGRAVEAIRSLDQAAKQVVEVQPTPVDRAADGKLVHVSGTMTAASPAQDRTMGVGGEGLLRLRRKVEMYQWVQHESSRTKTNVGGSQTTETTYTYSKEWSEGAQDSANFREPNGHRNPPLPVASETIDSSDVRLGGYRVAPAVLDQVSAFAPFVPGKDADLPDGFQIQGGGLYRGGDTANPAVGDLRIHYEAVSSQPISVVAGQSGSALAAYHGANNYEIAIAAPGVASASALFSQKEHEENQMTWVLRAVGFALLLFGFLLAGGPLSVAASVLPFLGGIVGAGTFLVALVLATPITLLVIACAWIAHRPVTGILLIAVAGGLIYGLPRLRRRSTAAATT